MSSAPVPIFAAPRHAMPQIAPVAGPSSLAAGIFAPGTKVQVGGHRVVIEKYLSEGGFAHVYLVRLPTPINGDDGAVLKRVAVPDKEALASMRIEVETMKKLKGHRHIVTYMDSHASQLKGGGYEVFLLMEYCAGGGLIDFMNTRLQNRLTEPEILKIVSDVAQGVACMHYLKPPLLHRDLKVENVLISSAGASKTFKLCDFGSTAPPRPAAKTAAEGRLIEDDVQKHTTLQYRSPEMIDVYRKQPINEKSDIWALGVLLYKLCYYTTPFEEQGQMAILNASFKFPAYPSFSDRLKKLIAFMLQEKPSDRPNIYLVIKEICAMRGTEVPIKDIYSGRTASEARRNEQLPTLPSNISSPPVLGAYKALPIEEKAQIPDITPMRRGRPISNLGTETVTKRPSPSPMRPVGGDPFAALDSNPAVAVGPNTVDEVSQRFPSLDQFSLLHESGGKFAFDQNRPAIVPSQKKDISQRVTEALADDAFAIPSSTKNNTPTHSKSAPSLSAGDIAANTPSQATVGKAIKVAVPGSGMVSTGTMTSPEPEVPTKQFPPPSNRPIFRFPAADQRSASQPRASDGTQPRSSSERETNLSLQPSLLSHRSKSQVGTLKAITSSFSSRPSLDSSRPPMGELESEMSRSKSTNSRVRPSSAQLDVSRLRPERSSSRGKSSMDQERPNQLASHMTGQSDSGNEVVRIQSNVEFLKAMEEDDPSKRKDKRSYSGPKSKRSSLPSISLSGTKSLLAGRFGDAFRRFETNTSSSPSEDRDSQQRDSTLTPIAGSEGTDGRSDDGQVVEETEETPPEVRRELERRRLSQEERRVAEGAAAYKQQLAQRGPDGAKPRGRDINRATLIQNKVQALLDESGKASPLKTAEGYGRFTHTPTIRQADGSMVPVTNQAPKSPIPPASASNTAQALQAPTSSASAPPTASLERSFARPSAPPKPQVLRTAGRGELLAAAAAAAVSRKPVAVAPVGTETQQMPAMASNDGTAEASEDWEANFSKRYPRLSGLEMVETEIDKSSAITVRDV